MMPGISFDFSARGVTKGFLGRIRFTCPLGATARCHGQFTFPIKWIRNPAHLPELQEDPAADGSRE
jgi:hypothetical protein